MEKNKTHPMTPFDELTSSRTLQTMKLLLPYTPFSIQYILGVMIRFMEFRQTISFFRGFPKTDSFGQSSARFGLLHSLKHYVSEEEAAQMEQLVNMMQMFQMMETMQGAGNTANPMDMMMGLLPPDQQELFHTYNSMFTDTINQRDSSDKKGDETNERMDQSSSHEEHGSYES